MAHFAKIDEQGNVLDVIIVSNDDAPDPAPDPSESAGQQFLANLGISGRWVQTSINTSGGVHSQGRTPLRYNYAMIGGTYDEDNDAFIPPQPWPSWILNTQTFLWEPPVPYPDDGNSYIWNEKNKSWSAI